MQNLTKSEPQEKSSINWPTLLLTGAIALAVSVIGGMTIYYLQLRGAKLNYSISSGLPFDGSDHTVSTYQVSITNDGNQSVDGISGSIYLSGSVIDQKRIDAEPSLNYTITAANDTVRFTIADINPSEHVQIKLLATAPPGNRSEPKVSIRGRGVTGKLKPLDSGNKESLIVPLTGTSFIALLTSIVGFERILRGRGRKDRHSDDQRRVFAYVLRLNGFVSEADALQASGAEAKYWSEADKLTRHALDSSDQILISRARCVLRDLLSYAAIHAESAALVNLNFAKLCGAMSDDQEAADLVAKAKQTGGELVRKRIAIDPELKKFSD